MRIVAAFTPLAGRTVLDVGAGPQAVRGRLRPARRPVRGGRQRRRRGEPARSSRHLRRRRPRRGAAAARRVGGRRLLQQRLRARPPSRRGWRRDGARHPAGRRRLRGVHELAVALGRARDVALALPRRPPGRPALRAPARAGSRRTSIGENLFRGLGRATVCGGPASSRTRSWWRRGRATTRAGRTASSRVPGVREVADLEPPARPAADVTRVAGQGGTPGHAAPSCSGSAAVGWPSLWSRWRSTRRPAGSVAGHQARPGRGPGRASSAGRAAAGTPQGRLRAAAEPGLRLPVPDGPVLRCSATGAGCRPGWSSGCGGRCCSSSRSSGWSGWPGGWASAPRRPGSSPALGLRAGPADAHRARRRSRSRCCRWRWRPGCCVPLVARRARRLAAPGGRCCPALAVALRRRGQRRRDARGRCRCRCCGCSPAGRARAGAGCWPGGGGGRAGHGLVARPAAAARPLQPAVPRLHRDRRRSRPRHRRCSTSLRGTTHWVA